MRIKQVQPNGNVEIQGKNFYKFEVTLDDGTSGEVLALTADRWKEGDEVEVTRKETQYGTKFKLSLPQSNNGGGGNYSSRKEDPDTRYRIEASWAITNAVAMGAKNHNDLVSKGLALLDARNAIVASLKGETKEDNSSNDLF